MTIDNIQVRLKSAHVNSKLLLLKVNDYFDLQSIRLSHFQTMNEQFHIKQFMLNLRELILNEE